MPVIKIEFRTRSCLLLLSIGIPYQHRFNPPGVHRPALFRNHA